MEEEIKEVNEINEILSLCEDSRKAINDYIKMINSDKVSFSADLETLEYLNMRMNLIYETNRLVIDMLKNLAE